MPTTTPWSKPSRRRRKDVDVGSAALPYSQTIVSMDTFVTIQVVGMSAQDEAVQRLEAAFGWFRRVDECCTRFNPTSEVMNLTAHVGEPVDVSPLLFEAVQFALTVARASGGAFDPTVGHTLEAQGFNRDYRTGRTVSSGIRDDKRVRYTDVKLDPTRRSITLRKPLVLDLGAVAKGMAIDLAARELRPFANYSIDAGGDIYVAGHNATGSPWHIGIRHPRHRDQILETLVLSEQAVCTSGDYERVSQAEDGGFHIVDPRTGHSPPRIASVTVIAPTAILADALGTAAFVLGPIDGIKLLERQGVEGSIVTSELDARTTPGYARYRQ